MLHAVQIIKIRCRGFMQTMIKSLRWMNIGAMTVPHLNDDWRKVLGEKYIPNH